MSLPRSRGLPSMKNSPLAPDPSLRPTQEKPDSCHDRPNPSAERDGPCPLEHGRCMGVLKHMVSGRKNAPSMNTIDAENVVLSGLASIRAHMQTPIRMERIGQHHEARRGERRLDDHAAGFVHHDPTPLAGGGRLKSCSVRQCHWGGGFDHHSRTEHGDPRIRERDIRHQRGIGPTSRVTDRIAAQHSLGDPGPRFSRVVADVLYECVLLGDTGR